MGQGERRSFVPPVPWKVRDTGLPESLLEQLTCNFLYARGDLTGRTIADSLGLSFSVIEPLLCELKARMIVDLKSSLGYGMISSVFALSEMGRKRCREASGASQYTGPAPVPLAQYVAAVKAQMPPKGWLNLETLSRAYRHVVMEPEVLSQIGPAINSGKSILIYGNPGNGKTFLAEALLNLDASDIFIPYAIENNGTIIQIFDPLHHRSVDGQDESGSLFSLERSFDSRWVKCKRPFIVSGGELSIEMLELSFNAETKVYNAPFHMKANNGMYLIDDFGRQRVSPAELLNRWIVPMESRMDHLSLPTGGKLAIPFEAFLLFSTNLNPSGLGDEAFLRRIQYKMFVRNPRVEEFRQIFVNYCRKNKLNCDDDLVDGFIERNYTRTKRRFRRCHPRDVVSHAMDLMDFEKLPYWLTDDLLDRAFATCFAEEEERDA